ncbi:Neural/ectodermal development factor IMP-L2, partial [Trachymyrmex cornetzi]
VSYFIFQYKFREKQPKDKNNYDTIEYNSMFLNYCTAEEVPDHESYDVFFDEALEEGDSHNSLKVQFAPPKRECKYEIALLVDPSIKNQKECMDYDFDKVVDIKSNIHTVDRSVCFFKNTNQSAFVSNDKSTTVYLYKDNIWLWFKYIFTGCYALRYRINNRKYITGHSIFLNTTYQRAEVQEPQVICKYKDIDTKQSDSEKKQVVKNFTLDIFLPANTGDNLRLGLISPRNKDQQKCIWRGEPILYSWTIRLKVVRVPYNEIRDQHCSIKLEKPTANGKYIKRVRCNFQIETQTEGHCFRYLLSDRRCQSDTIWKPECFRYSREDGILHEVPCLWLQRCTKSYEPQDTIVSRQIKSDMMLSASWYLLLPIIAIVLIISAVIGILCFWHYSCIRREEINLYINPQHDDSDYPKSIDFDIIDNVIEKTIDHGNSSCDDIVLLYTNHSTSFMTLMKDFRETLTKMCSCSVHDWHNGTVWNEVARVGTVSWFIKLFDNGCRVIWVDTPFTRSVVISNTRDNESSLDKLRKYYEIHDFRDMSFRAVLEVAKSKVNEVARQYRRHFVVRFEGLESTANVNDPFLDLSPHARYYMPQHLVQLCSDFRDREYGGGAITDSFQMQLCLAYLLTLVVATDVAFGSPLTFFLMTNASYTRANVDQFSAPNRLKNEIKSAGMKKSGFTTTWTRILQNPPDSLEVAVGSRVELQCEVVGNPPPQVYWITGNEPERQIQELTARAQETSNDISTEWEGLSQITSTYVIDCIRVEDQGLKYCVSVSKNVVVQSTPTVLLVNSTKATECNSESQPTITLHASWRFALDESTVILPCRVVGQPAPYLFWLDSSSKIISPTTHTRHTILPSGDLQITDLDWPDMGEYTCKVQSGYTEKSISTFLYPVLPVRT